MSEIAENAETTDHPDETDDWRAHAEWLHDACDVPMVEARVVALRCRGSSHRDVQETLGMSNPSESARATTRYRKRRGAAGRLIDEAPEI